MHEVFESVARYFSVLGEPTRLRILHALCQEERCVNGIIRVTGLAQANASRRREGAHIFTRWPTRCTSSCAAPWRPS